MYTIDLTIHPLPVLSITANPNDSICTGGSVTLSGSGATSYSWSGGITNNTSFTPSSSSNYIVTGTDVNGCTSSASTNIEVLANSVAVTVSAVPNDTLCGGSALVLSGNGANTYSWTGGVLDNTSFTPTSSIAYTVTGSDAYGCTNSTTINIVINPLPNISVSATPNDTICKGLDVLLKGSGANTYAWTGGISDSVAFAPLTTSTYTVTGTDAQRVHFISCSNS